MLIKPDFFDSFTCLASRCRHTCCAGWEIAVDPDTERLYESLLSGDELSRLIRTPDRLLLCREGERCGFLNPDGLCELILSHGEDSLCDICREHPRFYSYSNDGGICEAGVGLCCEEAARLWLEADPRFVSEDDFEDAGDEELRLLDAQAEQLRLALAGELPMLRYDRLLELYGRLETLEPLVFSDAEPILPDSARRLAAYYIYRWYFEYPRTAVLFAAANCVMTAALGGDFIDSARRLSCEVEYDPDNTAMLMESLPAIFSAKK